MWILLKIADNLEDEIHTFETIIDVEDYVACRISEDWPDLLDFDLVLLNCKDKLQYITSLLENLKKQ